MIRRNGHKYHAQRTEIDGYKFASKAEAKRYGELKILLIAGEIFGIELQPEFPLYVLAADGRGGHIVPIGKYRGDFSYFRASDKKRVVEDVKGFKTPLYRWKKKHVEAQYGITIQEITT